MFFILESIGTDRSESLCQIHKNCKCPHLILRAEVLSLLPARLSAVSSWWLVMLYHNWRLLRKSVLLSAECCWLLSPCALRAVSGWPAAAADNWCPEGMAKTRPCTAHSCGKSHPLCSVGQHSADTLRGHWAKTCLINKLRTERAKKNKEKTDEKASRSLGARYYAHTGGPRTEALAAVLLQPPDCFSLTALYYGWLLFGIILIIYIPHPSR